jgi:antitoxin (DNA-binding transcriptional repressor) of toxin-antitoxin stability system
MGPNMIELDFREVIERFDEILDAVERGETFSVFRAGRPIAIMQKSQAEDLAEADTAGPA